MSRITGPKGGDEEAFGMRIVSGLYHQGGIRITWSSGQKATSQIDWGLTPVLGNTTNETDTGTNMVKYHSVNYPNVYVDAEHYFRARSRNDQGEVKQSKVYSVLIPALVALQASGLDAEQELEIKEVAMAEQENELGMRVDVQKGVYNEPEPNATLQPNMTHTETDDYQVDEATTFGTNYNITVEDEA